MCLKTAVSVVVVIVAQLLLSSVNTLDPNLSSNPAVTEETHDVISKETNDTIPKETNDTIPKKTNDTIPKETNYAIPKQTIPVIVKETNDATLKETNSAIPKETIPVVEKETSDAILKETNPVIPKEINPTIPKDTSDAIPKETNPSIPKETIPVISKETSPAIYKETNPATPKETNPAIPKEINPAIPKETNHAIPKEIHPAIYKETIVTGSNGKCRKYTKSPDDNEYRIAWLAPKKEYYNFSAATSVGAMKLALKRIQLGELNHDLKGGTLRAKWYDTNCDSKQALQAFVQSIEDFDPDVIIGPPCSTGLRCVAQLGSIWNLPVFSWVSDLLDFKDKDKYTTLVRLSGPLYATSEIVRQTSLYFKWQNYALISDKAAPYEAVAVALRQAAGADTNYTIRSVHYVTPDTKDSEIKEMMQQIKKFARVIIFVVPYHMLRHYLLIAHSLDMANGEFAFICINGDVFTWEVMDTKILSDWGWKRNDTDDEKAREIFESVIHIIMDPPNKDEEFLNEIKNVSVADFPNWEIPFDGSELDAHAPYLYDAMITWADCVHYILNKSLGNPRNGSLMYKQVPEASKSKGITGSIVFNEPGRDRMLNYRVLDMLEDGTFYNLYHFKYADKKFMRIESDDPTLYPLGGRWPTRDGKRPPDIPVCGFDGEKCVEESESMEAACSTGCRPLTLA
ncbi:hypothetical protein DPMN_014311 [Dreissena polymorpha]|uniref:Receptor ligand binding region domain-containing protein n=1 Tax=Dreissena polymorpha TaxID=45954 RepID=A0A9D4N5S6_DREPO|nr:hypothetical protein DPMN_014311 [Dreissena polymorpha]